MRGLFVKTLLCVLILTGSVAAQGISDTVALSQIVNYPDVRFISQLGLVDFFTVEFPYSMDFQGSGTRAAGMGNAFIGVSNDISAVSWNPAGLYEKDSPFEQPVIGLGYSTYSPKGEFETSTLLGSQRYDSDANFNNLALFSFLAPIRIKGHPFVMSASYNRLNDEFYNAGIHFEEQVDYFLSDEKNPLGLFSIDSRYNYHSGINAINFGFGTRLYEDVSVGFSVNVYTGKAVGNQFSYGIWDGIAKEYGFLEIGEGIDYYTPDDPQPVTLYASTRFIDSTSYSGVYFTLGSRYVNDDLALGLVLRAPHTLRQTTDVTMIMERKINGLVTAYGNETLFFDDNVLELDMPIVIGVGAGLTAIENLLLSLDLEYRAHGGGDIRIRDSILLIPGERDKEFFTTIDPKWNDVFSVRMGAEYLLQVGKSFAPVVPLRVGYAHTGIPQPNIDGLDIDLQTQTVGIGQTSGSATKTLSFGTGTRWDQIHIDVAYVYSWLDRDDLALSWNTSTKSSSLQFMFTGYF